MKRREFMSSAIGLSAMVAAPAIAEVPKILSEVPLVPIEVEEDDGWYVCTLPRVRLIAPKKTYPFAKPGDFLWSGEFGMGRDSLETNVESETA